MMNPSVLVHENDGSPHLHLYPKILPITCKCKGAKGLRSTIVIFFSNLGASFTGIVRNARVPSHRCDITYARTASNCRLKYK